MPSLLQTRRRVSAERPPGGWSDLSVCPDSPCWSCASGHHHPKNIKKRNWRVIIPYGDMKFLMFPGQNLQESLKNRSFCPTLSNKFNSSSIQQRPFSTPHPPRHSISRPRCRNSRKSMAPLPSLSNCSKIFRNSSKDRPRCWRFGLGMDRWSQGALFRWQINGELIILSDVNHYSNHVLI